MLQGFHVRSSQRSSKMFRYFTAQTTVKKLSKIQSDDIIMHTCYIPAFFAERLKRNELNLNY